MRQFYTAPTLVRSLEAQDDKFVMGHDRSSLRILGTVGEPINPRAWMWFFEVRLSLPPEACPAPFPQSSRGMQTGPCRKR